MIGIDLVEVSRIQKSISRYGDKFLYRIFTEAEIAYCEGSPKNRFLRYAARFAAKEAVAKVIQKGPKDFWKDIEVTHNENGAPEIRLSKRLRKHFPDTIAISLTHTENYAAAVAMIAVKCTN